MMPNDSNAGNGPSAGDVRRACLRRGVAGLAAILAAGRAPAVFAAPGGLPSAGHGDTSPQWDLLRAKLYADRPIETAPDRSLVELVAPGRAAYGASVPLRIVSRISQSPERWVRRMALVIDKNPSPLAATLELTPLLGQADLTTRVRVDEYSHVRVVAELSDGSLHAASRYVKVSGGCSAPPNREHPELIGRTAFRLLGPVQYGQLVPAEVSVVHPNDTGFELNQVSVMFIPPHFVRTVDVTWNGKPLLRSEQDFSISENPTWGFALRPPGPGRLHADVLDSREQHFEGELQL